MKVIITIKSPAPITKKTLCRILSGLLLFTLLFSPITGHFIQPVYASEIANAQQIYNASPFYSAVEQTIVNLDTTYDAVTERRVIGTSVDGNNICAVRLGTGSTEFFIFGATHGRESITTILLLDQIEEMAKAYDANELYNGYQIKKILDNVSIWFVPLINPDGAEIAMNGAANIKNQNLLYSIVPEDFNFKLWKSNLNGVDLNRNYHVGEPQKNVTSGSSFYYGPYAYSEPETQAFMKFCEERQFKAILSYHAAGNIIYADSGHWELGNVISTHTGYPISHSSTSSYMPSFDVWIESKFAIPTFTIEVTPSSLAGGPASYSKYWDVWERNKNVPVAVAYHLVNKQAVTASVNGEKVALSNPAVLHDGITLVPLRSIATAMGATLDWNQESETITLSKNSLSLTCVIGLTSITISNEVDGSQTQRTLETPATLMGGVTYVPIRQIAEALDYEVGFDFYSKTISLTELPPIVEPEPAPTPDTSTDIDSENDYYTMNSLE